ncbi:MAG: molybdopterin-guanine dinucleotide biosynthesis protein B [Pseudomonadota bacterium]
MRVIGVTGWKDQGKTTLVAALVRHFTGEGLSVSTIKHAHAGFDIDQPGRDSFRHREAGAREVVLASPRRVAVVEELRSAPEPTLGTLLARMQTVDLVVVEGYKDAPHPKIEVYREDRGKPPLALTRPTIRAVAGTAAGFALPVPVLPIDDIPGLAAIALREAE